MHAWRAADRLFVVLVGNVSTSCVDLIPREASDRFLVRAFIANKGNDRHFIQKTGSYIPKNAAELEK